MEGLMHLKTDNTFLYQYTYELLSSMKSPIEFHHDDIYTMEDIEKALTIETTYERKFKALGETIKYIRFRLN